MQTPDVGGGRPPQLPLRFTTIYPRGVAVLRERNNAIFGTLKVLVKQEHRHSILKCGLVFTSTRSYLVYTSQRKYFSHKYCSLTLKLFTLWVTLRREAGCKWCSCRYYFSRNH